MNMNTGIILAGVLIVAGIWLTSLWMDRLYKRHGPDNESEKQQVRRS